MFRNTQNILPSGSLRAVATGLVLTLVLVGCSSVQSSLGLGKNAPDEFAVVKKAPLILPPDYALRPPRPGAQRPREVQPVEEARKAVFGKKDSKAISAAAQGENILLGNKRPSVPKSAGEMALLGNAGAEPGQAAVRKQIRLETTSVAAKGKSFSEKLMFWDEEDETSTVTINASEEAARLKKAREEGKPAGTSQAPVIRRKSQTLLDKLF